MKKNALRRYIVIILTDIRGDNEFPSDQVIQANADLLLNYVDKMIDELREEYKDITKIEIKFPKKETN